MKLIYDGKELETGGGGGLSQEEADERYLQKTGGEVVSPGDGSEEGKSIAFVGRVADSSDLARIEVGTAGFAEMALHMNESQSRIYAATSNNGDGYDYAYAGMEASNDFEYFSSIKVDPAEIRISMGIGDEERMAAVLARAGEGVVFRVSSAEEELISADLNGVTISRCAEPETDEMPATKGYVDNAVSGAGIPAGVIVMWSGTAIAIPSGWALCNGQNGTPDLRDRFVVGAGSSYAVGAKGGEASHTLTVEEMPRHSHSVSSLSSTSSGSLPVGSGGSRLENSSKTTVATGGGAAHNNMPPYYALCYIMKL